MGNENGHSYGLDPTQHARLIQSQPGLEIYQDAQGQQFQKYLVVYDGSSSFDNTYYFRVTNHHQYLVDVIFAAPPQSLVGCAQPAAYHIVTERIPYRLAHLPPQTPENAFTILQSTLRGFKDLYQVHGVMSVKDTMIGVTPKNRVKVWLNPNFALNKPEPKPLSLQNLDPLCHEREMVHNIFDLISSKAENSNVWKDLTRARQSRSIKTFGEAEALVEQMIKQKRLKVNGELKNPFNKCQYGKKSQIYTLNSEIDKLEEIKLEPHSIKKPEESISKQAHPPVPTLDFSSLRNKALHINQKPSQSNRQELVQSSRISSNEVNFKPLRQPFQQIQRRMAPTPQPPANFIKHQSASMDKIMVPIQPPQSGRLIHFNQIANNPRQKNTVNHSYSQPKSVQIKFNYQKNAPVPLTNSINLIVPRPYIQSTQTLPSPPQQPAIKLQPIQFSNFLQEKNQFSKTPISFTTQPQTQIQIQNQIKPQLQPQPQSQPQPQPQLNFQQNISIITPPVQPVRNDTIKTITFEQVIPQQPKKQQKKELLPKQTKKAEQEVKIVNEAVIEVKPKAQDLSEKERTNTKGASYKNMFDELYDAQSTESLHIYKQQVESITSQEKMADNFDSDEQPSVHRNFAKNKQKQDPNISSVIQQTVDYQIKINKVASQSSLGNDNQPNEPEKLLENQQITQRNAVNLKKINVSNQVSVSNSVAKTNVMNNIISIESNIIKKTEPQIISKTQKQQETTIPYKAEKQQAQPRKKNEQNLASAILQNRAKLTSSGTLRQKLSSLSYKEMRKMLQQSLQGN